MNIAHTIVLLLAVSIVSTAAAGEAPPAEVPMPENLDVEQLPPPIQWQQMDRDPLLERRLEFSFDLDLLAPLGTGAGNSAVWLAQLNSGDPEQPETEYLAEEVAPWADQARCSFYPEVYTFEGPATALPDSGALVEIASAWAAEARQDPARAGELGRRTLRLGRLLLMDELSAVQHQTGLALIAAGAAILYDHGRRAGDGALTTLTQRAIGDAANQRRLIADWAKAVGPARTMARTRDSLFAHPCSGPTSNSRWDSSAGYCVSSPRTPTRRSATRPRSTSPW